MSLTALSDRERPPAPAPSPAETRKARSEEEERASQRRKIEERLTARAAVYDVERYYAARALADAAMVVQRDLYTRRQAAAERRRQIAARLDALRRATPNEWEYASEAAELGREDAERAAEIARLDAARERAEPSTREAALLAARLEAHLRASAALGTRLDRATALRAHDEAGEPSPARVTLPPAPRRKAGTTLHDAVAAQRGEIERLVTEREETERAPRPLEEAVARIDAWLAARTEQVATTGGMFAAPGELPRSSASLVRGEREDLAGLFILLNRTALRERLVADARQHLEGHAPGLPEAERAARLAQIDGEIFRGELAEEALIREAEASGLAITRRGSADVRAVLAFVAGEDTRSAA